MNDTYSRERDCNEVVVWQEWGVLSTASAAFSLSHSEGSRVPRVAVQSRGHGTLTVSFTYREDMV